MTDFKINSAGTKKEIIDQFTEFLEEHKQAVREREAARKRLTELEKKVEERAIGTAQEATVESVVSSIGQLKTQIGATMNDLVDQMAAQAEKLEEYKKAIAAQERRLKELYDLESTADALAKLVEAYSERKQQTEEEFAGRVAQMNAEIETRNKTSLDALNEQKENLERAINDQRAKWLEEKELEKKQKVEAQNTLVKEREREESEYLYQRDKTRKLDQDDYSERKKLLEKEMTERKEHFEKEIAAKEAALATREQKLGELERQVAEFPVRLTKEVTAAEKRVGTELIAKHEHQTQLATSEQTWEKKMFEQRVAHLQELIAAHEKKIALLEGELGKAQLQVNEVAKKAIEGASLNKAFQSVNQIALEQARLPERKKTGE